MVRKTCKKTVDLNPCVCVCVYQPVLSGIAAWSLFLSFLKTMLPNWSTADTTFNMAAENKEKVLPSH